MKIRSFSGLTAPVLLAFLLAGPSLAQDEAPAPDAVEIDRDAFELRDLSHPDVDTVQTVAVFSNPGRGRVRVLCTALDQQGNILGRAATTVPGNGLRYVRASDASNGVDFVGQLRCWTAGHAVGSAFILGPGFMTDAPVRQSAHGGRTRIRIPVAASF